MTNRFLGASPLLSLSVSLIACSSSDVPSASAPQTNVDTLMEAPSNSASSEMVVYKSASCGCCRDWIAYIEKAGFSVKAINHENIDTFKGEHGLTSASLKSCHTAIIDGYVIEGHVPVSDIERLLAERPAVVGLSAPDMPMLSPGLGSETPRNYEVLAFDKNGRTRVYSSYSEITHHALTGLPNHFISCFHPGDYGRCAAACRIDHAVDSRAITIFI